MMHDYSEEIGRLAEEILDYARRRTELEPIPTGGTATPEALAELVGETITTGGLGGSEALRVFIELLAPNCLSVDNPRFLAFVPAAPTEASILFDLVVGSESIYAGSWLEAAGSTYAENQALRWLSDLAGLGPDAGGVFVQGGTVGNLSAMVGARGAAGARLERLGRPRPNHWVFLISDTAHSSVPSAAMIMDAEVVEVATGSDRRLTGSGVAEALATYGDRVAGVVATAGSTNLGVIDDLQSVGEVCRANEVFFHVDAAYGGAALAAPKARPLFDGIELADSIIIDPHKWLFAPFDSCALLWRDPAQAQVVHAQHADYLSFLDRYGEWNPSDYAIQLSRRARGLPFWFSVAAYGTDAYAESLQATLDIAQVAADRVHAADHLNLLWGPSLSVVVFERIGWGASDYEACTDAMIASGTGFVTPTRHDGRPVYRFCFVNPRTTAEDVDALIAAMA